MSRAGRATDDGSNAFQPKLAGFDSAIAWLANHDVPASRVAGLFGTNENHIRQLGHRGRRGKQKYVVDPWLVSPVTSPNNPFETPNAAFKQRIGLRKEEDTVHLYRRDRRRLTELEEKIDLLGREFWRGVRFGAGLQRLRNLRQEIGFVSHVPRIRLRARLEHLVAETHLHVGRSASALQTAFLALHLWRTAWAESQDAFDLRGIARTALLLSQAHLLRHEPDTARGYLDLHEHASSRARSAPGAEFYRQRAVASFQEHRWDQSCVDFERAASALAVTVEYGRGKERYEVLNIGQRQLNLLTPVNWEGALELLAYMESALSPGDIHRSMNLNWTVACGFATDDPKTHLQAQDLLEKQSALSDGFGHQATVSRLLSLTPALPPNLKADWVRHALYENAFRNS